MYVEGYSTVQLYGPLLMGQLRTSINAAQKLADPA
jgi:hypothetical protein